MNRLMKRYNKLILIRLFGELLTSTTGAMLAIIFIVYVNKALEGNVILTMLLFGLQPLTDIIFTLFAGGVTDRYGRKSIMLIGLCLQAIAMGGFVFAESVPLFALLYVINGIGRSLYIPAQRAQIADITEHEKQAEVFALIQTVGAIGTVIGPLIGYFFYENHPEFLFILQAVTLVLYAILVWTQLPETAPTIQTSEHGAQSITWKQFILRHYAVFGLMVSTLPISFFYAQTETNYRVFAEDIFPNFLFVFTFISTCKAVMEIILQVGLVKWSERFSMPKIIIISYICYTFAAIGYGYSNTLWTLFFTLFLLTIGESIALNHLLRFVAEMAPNHMRGRYFSIYGIHWDISRTCGPAVGAVILNHFSGGFLFTICALFLLFGGIAQTIFVHSLEQHRTKKLSL
ncbi:MFS transporter [Bacillus sp. DX1.1]|uniref:MDR family MFS transporter n=1 Tax=unclassified Bacillus (in: firmicutes) TaxID=185979 RepID=UPI00256FE701|nr:MULTISPECIES: MFS transporter [unclassified Bacillus (in: firmicutes)]MDM5155235.1 MFS transporter [Bacillus sp. DX1.1]WJE79555.1 MFS transporter [Bacillus sp. DX3.1]